MKNADTHGLKFCFISNSNHSYLNEYIEISQNDFRKDYSFENLNLLNIKEFNPDVIIIDEYFKNKAYSSIINSIKLNFKHTTIYFLSPEYANYNSIIQSINHKTHFYSNFSIDILKQINTQHGSRNNFLEAS
jgi:hypothetical protein